MEGDRLPHSVSALGCHLMLQTKFSSSVGTVHFKAIFSGMGGNEPKVVQNGRAKSNLIACLMPSPFSRMTEMKATPILPRRDTEAWY
jgi:hypothetical protein